MKKLLGRGERMRSPYWALVALISALVSTSVIAQDQLSQSVNRDDVPLNVVSAQSWKIWAGLPDYAAWGIWVFLLVIALLLFLRKSKTTIAKTAAPAPAPAAACSPQDQDWLSRVVPIVRIRRNASRFLLPGFKRDELIALFPDQLVQMRKRRSAAVDPVFEPDAESRLDQLKGARVRRHLPIASITRTEIEKTTLMNRIGIRVHAEKSSLRFQVLERDMPNLLRALELLAPGRVVTGCPISYQLEFVSIVLMLLFSLSIPLLLIGYWFAIPLLIVFALSVAIYVLAHTPKPHWRIDHDRKKTEDLSMRRPFRSRALSLVAKLAAVAFLISYIFKLRTFVPMTMKLQYYDVLGVIFVFSSIVQIANSLWQRAPAKLRVGVFNRPILYLRSFLDDRVTTLNPGTYRAWLLGVEPPLYSIERYLDTPIGPFLRAIYRYFGNYHPLRLLRLLFNRAQDTSEEQMAAFFKRYGTFVAIGKPGEHFATTGAERMYVGNDEWQAIVEELLAESQAVVLQPASTEGIWWEVEHSIRSVPPERLLLCMVNYRDRQNDYETFRLRLEKFLPGTVRVPRATGCRNSISFFRFEPNWRPVELPVVNHWWFLWLFKKHAVNFQRTLAPFLHPQ
jgi:hypothetical protein